MKIKITCEYIMDTVEDVPDGDQTLARVDELVMGSELYLKARKEQFLDFLHDNSADLEAILGLKFEEIN